MNILVLGGGGREHAIAWALAKSPRTDSLYVAPGNGGTDGIAQNVPDLNPEDGQAVLAFVRENAIDFVVIGPEAPLVAGVADVLRAAGVPTFGPDAQGAQLEGSKTFSKKFMDANDIPTARYASFTDLEPALAYVRELGLDACCEDEERLPKLITNVYNSLPSWENNGWSPQELLERMAGKKVFYNERGDVMKVGRNDPCPCGSGKKYKKCCGR